MKKFKSFVEQDDFDPEAVIPDTPPLSPKSPTLNDSISNANENHVNLAYNNNDFGFTLASGKPIKPPSADGYLKAAKLFNENNDDKDDDSLPHKPTLSQARNFRVEALNNLTNSWKFSSSPTNESSCTPTKTNIPSSSIDISPISQKSKDITQEELSSSQSSINENIIQNDFDRPFIGFTSGAGKPINQPSKQALENARKTLFDDKNDENLTKSVTSNSPSKMTVPQSKPPHQIQQIIHSQTQQVNQINNIQKHSIENSQKTPNIPSLVSKTFHQNQNKASPFKPPLANLNRAENLSTPKAIRPRISLGLSTTKQVKRTKFVTPFKTGVVPTPSLGTTPSKVTEPSSTVIPKQKKFFSMTCETQRKNMRSYGLRPFSYTLAYLKAVNIPQIILNMNPTIAQNYQFDNSYSYNDAYNYMKLKGCTIITINWVKNHWRFILWKLSSIIRSCPSELSRWNNNEILNQLLYRYEREINLAERSSIKRIQEHDSASTRPIVLCVSNLNVRFNVIELTDGWYPINCQIDECLSKAIKKSKINVGTKLSIIGAKVSEFFFKLVH